jgi:hypothetical protein
MAFRPVRQKRYEMLRNKGFLPFEARALSRVPKKVPYIKSVIGERTKFRNRGEKEGWSKLKYEQEVRALYKKKGWTVGGANSPWAMVKDYETKYKDKHPEYTSPWVKKQKQWKDFERKFEARLQPVMQSTKDFVAKQLEEQNKAFEHIKKGKQAQ